MTEFGQRRAPSPSCTMRFGASRNSSQAIICCAYSSSIRSGGAGAWHLAPIQCRNADNARRPLPRTDRGKARLARRFDLRRVVKVFVALPRAFAIRTVFCRVATDSASRLRNARASAEARLISFVMSGCRARDAIFWSNESIAFAAPEFLFHVPCLQSVCGQFAICFCPAHPAFTLFETLPERIFRRAVIEA